MKLFRDTPHKGSVAHICTHTGMMSVPVCRVYRFFAREKAARRLCPQCVAVVKAVLRQRPK